MSGSSAANAAGVYGTEGTAATTNIPGARHSAVSWIDSSGNLWLFGGSGPGLFGTGFNDLWEFNPTTKEWTWMSGSNTIGWPYSHPGVYGTLGTPAASNVPGARYGAVSWKDNSGKFWLFGGYTLGNGGPLNDLWEFNPTTKEWTWMSGSNNNTIGWLYPYSGDYGTLGVPAAGNVPGGRANSVGWTDSSGNLWLFGGYGIDALGQAGDLNDLWRYQP